MRVLALAIALAVSGCVHTETMMLDPRTAIISGRGNAYSSTGQVHNQILREAAAKTVAAGFTHFVILNRQDASSEGAYFQPGTTTTTGQATASCFGNTCNAFGSATTRTTPGYAIPMFYPGADVTVRFLRADEVKPDMPYVWEAAVLLVED
jgi:hypothetical protein